MPSRTRSRNFKGAIPRNRFSASFTDREKEARSAYGTNVEEADDERAKDSPAGLDDRETNLALHPSEVDRDALSLAVPAPVLQSPSQTISETQFDYQASSERKEQGPALQKSSSASEETKLELIPTEKNAMREVEKAIQKAYNKIEPVRGMPGFIRIKTACFEVHCDLCQFLKENYSAGLHQTLRDVITISGGFSNAEAMPCASYVARHWGEAGTKILVCIEAALQCKSEWCRLHLDKHIDFFARFDRGMQTLYIRVSGDMEQIVKVGQQVAWLGAACRAPSPCKGGGINATTPVMQCYNNLGASLNCELTYLDMTPEEQFQGQCWHAIFGNATIALGFPIAERHFGEIGLEIDMALMVDLCSTPYAVIWRGGYVLKGFSTMIVPTARVRDSDSIQWHLIYDSSGGRLPYHKLDGVRRSPTGEVSMELIESGRAFLGWCASVDCTIGMQQVTLPIFFETHVVAYTIYSGLSKDLSVTGFSGLHNCGPGYGLSSLSISSGKFLSVAGSFTRGKKDKAIHISRESCFVKLMDDLVRSRIVLYESKGQRAFLVDGSQALPYLLRTTLQTQHYRAKASELLLPALELDRKSVIQFLLAKADMRLLEDEQVHEDGRRSHYYLRDLIFKTWYTLELLRDHESAVQFQGLEIPKSWNHMLFGWEFMAVATEKQSLVLKSANLKGSAAGWTALVRDSQALVLFAHEFGEVYLPSATDQNAVCIGYQTLPCHKDMIAIPNWLLEELYEESGCSSTRTRLNSKIKWSLRGHPFKPCNRPRCDDVAQELHHDSFRSFFVAQNKVRPPQRLDIRGAVIFGWPGSAFNWFKRTVEDVAASSSELPDSGSTSSRKSRKLQASYTWARAREAIENRRLRAAPRTSESMQTK